MSGDRTPWIAGDLVISAVYADIDHFGLADVWWADLTTGATGGNGFLTMERGIVDLPERPATAPLRVDHEGFKLEIVDDDSGTRLVASWTEHGAAAHLASKDRDAIGPTVLQIDLLIHVLMVADTDIG